MWPGLLAMVLLPFGACHAADRAVAAAVNLYKVGSERQLFIDDLFFESSHGVVLRVHPPRKTGERTLEGDRSWENASLNWFNVLQEGSRLRMWYECYDVPGWPTTNDTSFCYAESKDGRVWTKPNLGLVEYQGSRSNNILFRTIGPATAHSRVHGSGLFVDPTAAPEARYKVVSQGLFDQGFDAPYRIAGMFSGDGFHWTRYPAPICLVFADSQYGGDWDPRLKKFVIYGRVSGRGRSLGRAESENFASFEPLQRVLEVDDQDPPGSDLYNPAPLRYPHAAHAHFMFPSLFRHEPQTLDIRMAASRDGVHWTWPERVPFIALGAPGAFDSGSLYMGQGLVRKGEELWQYFSGSPLRHDQAELENLTQPGKGRVYSRVVSRLDGWVSVDAGAAGGDFVTPPLTFAGNLLKLNVQVRRGGVVRVGLRDEGDQPIPGRDVADCLPIHGDDVDFVVRWKHGRDVSGRAGKPTRLCVELKEASLYAFQFGTRGSR